MKGCEYVASLAISSSVRDYCSELDAALARFTPIPEAVWESTVELADFVSSRGLALGWAPVFCSECCQNQGDYPIN